MAHVVQNKIVKDLRGNVIAPYDIPPAGMNRWTPARKALVVRAVQGELITLDEVLERYKMTEPEFRRWESSLKTDGALGLKVTKFQQLKRQKAQSA